MTTMGIEPTIFRFEVGRLIHWATRPYQLVEINLYMYLYSSEKNLVKIITESKAQIVLFLSSQYSFTPILCLLTFTENVYFKYTMIYNRQNFKLTHAFVAQGLEHWSCKPGVESSNLSEGFYATFF